MTILEIRKKKQQAYMNAVRSLARYKFVMFGYWAGVWVHLNQLDQPREPNPFKPFVMAARDLIGP